MNPQLCVPSFASTAVYGDRKGTPCREITATADFTSALAAMEERLPTELQAIIWRKYFLEQQTEYSGDVLRALVKGRSGPHSIPPKACLAGALAADIERGVPAPEEVGSARCAVHDREGTLLRHLKKRLGDAAGIPGGQDATPEASTREPETPTNWAKASRDIDALVRGLPIAIARRVVHVGPSLGLVVSGEQRVVRVEDPVGQDLQETQFRPTVGALGGVALVGIFTRGPSGRRRAPLSWNGSRTPRVWSWTRPMRGTWFCAIWTPTRTRGRTIPAETKTKDLTIRATRAGATKKERNPDPPASRRSISGTAWLMGVWTRSLA